MSRRTLLLGTAGTAISGLLAGCSTGRTLPLPPPSDTECQPRMDAEAWGGLTYATSDFGQEEINRIAATVRITEPEPASSLYLQLYQTRIGAYGFTFGMQSARGDDGSPIGRILCSLYGTNDTRMARWYLLDSVDIFAGSEPGQNGDERYLRIHADDASLQAGTWKFDFRRGDADHNNTSDWFDLYVQRPGQPEPSPIGGFNIPRRDPSRPSPIEDGGSSWIEMYDIVPGEHARVARWSTQWTLRANDELPLSITTAYPKPRYDARNSDIFVDNAGAINATVGDDGVCRTHDAATYETTRLEPPTITPS